MYDLRNSRRGAGVVAPDGTHVGCTIYEYIDNVLLGRA